MIPDDDVRKKRDEGKQKATPGSATSSTTCSMSGAHPNRTIFFEYDDMVITVLIIVIACYTMILLSIVSLKVTTCRRRKQQQQKVVNIETAIFDLVEESTYDIHSSHQDEVHHWLPNSSDIIRTNASSSTASRTSTSHTISSNANGSSSKDVKKSSFNANTPQNLLGSNISHDSIEEANHGAELIVPKRDDQETTPEAKDDIETRKVDQMVPPLKPEFVNQIKVCDANGEETATKVKNIIPTRKIDSIFPPFKLQVVNVGKVDAVSNKGKNGIVTNDGSKAYASQSQLTCQEASLVCDARSDAETSSIDDENPQNTRRLHMPTLKAIEEWLKSDTVANSTMECEEAVGLASRIHRATVYQMRDKVRDYMTVNRDDGSTNTEYDLLYNDLYQREEFLSVATEFSRSVVEGSRGLLPDAEKIKPSTFKWLKNASGLSRDSQIHKDAFESYFDDGNDVESSGNAMITTAGDVLAISRRSNRVKSMTEKKKFEEKQLRNFNILSGVAEKLEKQFQRKNIAKRKLVATKKATNPVVLRARTMNDKSNAVKPSQSTSKRSRCIVERNNMFALKKGLREAHFATAHHQQVNVVLLATGDSAPPDGSAAKTGIVLSQMKATPGDVCGSDIQSSKDPASSSTKCKFSPDTSGGDKNLHPNANISDIQSIIELASRADEQWLQVAMDGSSAIAVAQKKNDKEAELSAHDIISRAAKRQKHALNVGFSSVERSLTTGRNDNDKVLLEAAIMTANTNSCNSICDTGQLEIFAPPFSNPEAPFPQDSGKRIYYMQKKVVVTTTALGLIIKATGERVIVERVKNPELQDHIGIGDLLMAVGHCKVAGLSKSDAVRVIVESARPTVLTFHIPATFVRTQTGNNKFVPVVERGQRKSMLRAKKNAARTTIASMNIRSR